MSTPTPTSTTETPAIPAQPMRGTILVGAVLGAALGAAAAYAFSRRNNRPQKITAGQVFKAGMLLLGTARQLAALLEEAAEEG